MTTIEILICTIDKGVVRIFDNLPSLRPDVSYLVAYQFTDSRYLELVPAALIERPDVRFVRHPGKGLSKNRNFALSLAKGDVVVFADDDARFSHEGFDAIERVFAAHAKLDIAFFQASTYTGRQLKSYPSVELPYTGGRSAWQISTLEMACRRSSIQGRLLFDERFGLGCDTLPWGEQEVWLEDARRLGLSMCYFPVKIVETSTMLKQRMLYIDRGVQRSYGAVAYYKYGPKAYLRCLRLAIHAARRGRARFFPLIGQLLAGIRFLQRNPAKR